MENRDLTKVQNQRVDELEAEIQGLINNGCQSFESGRYSWYTCYQKCQCNSWR